MCGIAGFIGPGNPDDLRRMTRHLAHRGPDGEGFWQEGAVYLGNRRLQIVDLPGGAQPMVSADGNLVVTFNGEIYNAPELRRILEDCGHSFRSDHSDTEVLLSAYVEWGESMVDRLNGMWAFTIFDRTKRQLFASRDRFGKKPFYYHHGGARGLFAFASELTALLQHPEVPRNISPLAMRKFFAWNHVPAPLSMIEGVAKLPGGHSLIYQADTGQLRTWRYWRYEPEPMHDGSIVEQCEELRELLTRAVRRRLRADVPVGLWLSGGLDSSIVAALASNESPDTSLPAFTIGFDQASYDETRYAETVAKHLGLRHFAEILTREHACGLIPNLLGSLDEPNGDASLLPTYLLSEISSRQVKVVLSGEGGDELFGGYTMFPAQGLANSLHRLIPSAMHPAIIALADRIPVSHRYISAEYAAKRFARAIAQPQQLQLPVMMAGLDSSDLSELFQENIRLEEVYSEAIEEWDGAAGDTPFEQATAFFIRFYLQENVLAKVDRASMLHGLEARCPFLDIEVVDFCRRLPRDFKLRNGRTKFLLKEAARGLLPSQIINRPKKGFGAPAGNWFREGALSINSQIFPSPEQAALLAEEHSAGRRNLRVFLWNALVYGTWSSNAQRIAAEISEKTVICAGEKNMASATEPSSL